MKFEFVGLTATPHVAAAACRPLERTWQTGKGTDKWSCDCQAMSFPSLLSPSLVSEKPGHSFGYSLFRLYPGPQFRIHGVVLLFSSTQSEVPVPPLFSSHVKAVYRPLSHTVASLWATCGQPVSRILRASLSSSRSFSAFAFSAVASAIAFRFLALCERPPADLCEVVSSSTCFVVFCSWPWPLFCFCFSLSIVTSSPARFVASASIRFYILDCCVVTCVACCCASAWGRCQNPLTGTTVLPEKATGDSGLPPGPAREGDRRQRPPWSKRAGPILAEPLCIQHLQTVAWQHCQLIASA